MFDNPDAARSRAEGPTYICEVRLREGLGINVAKTFDDPAHFTVWADPDELLSLAIVLELVP
jgi:hypothetical protein